MLNVAKINLNVLMKNALAIKSKLSSGVKFCAVVKADAYGHGASRVANHLYSVVDCYAVALVEEGEELRASGIDKDILVLTPLMKCDIERAVRRDLTITVESKQMILAIDKESKKQGKKTKIHLKFNGGMNRFGVDGIAELKELLDCAKDKKQVILDGMYAHLGCPQNKKLLKDAENKFLLANKLVKSYNNKATCHLSASGGFLMGLEYDMVRIGILLYGYKPFKSNAVRVAPVMKVISPIVKRRNLGRGANALYGEYKVGQSQKVSIVRFGYADGLPRKKASRQINNRCMDVSMFSDFNKDVLVMDDAEELAKEYDTIPYEILTKIAIRAQKIYIQ